MRLVMVGINHDTAPVDVREQLAFDRAQREQALGELLARPDVAEAMLLSTCNRTELYARQAADADTSLVEFAGRLVTELIRLRNANGLDPDLFQTRFDDDAVQYLFRVAAGLESMVKGEAQILAQVKDAYRTACGARGCDVMLHKLLHSTFRVGKKARAVTNIGVGSVSVGLAAIEFAQQAFGELHDRRALVVGAGEVAALVARHAVARGAALSVTNRTESRAHELAATLGGRAVPFERLAEAVADADLVVTSTASPEPLITRETMLAIAERRKNEPILLIDLAVPRNIEPVAGDVDGVTLAGIDGLRGAVDHNLRRREEAVPEVERILEEEFAAFRRWHKSLEVVPAIQDMISVVETIRRDEIERVAKHFSPEQLERIDRLTRAIVKKILHHPITSLRDDHVNGGEDAE